MPQYRGGFSAVGGNPDTPDFLYYNADIVNNNQLDQNNGVAITDPQVRFNETRDKPILENCADYHFSIIRFSMNGANLDLPLFCPTIALCSQYPQWQQIASPGNYKVGDEVIYEAFPYQCIQASGSGQNAPPAPVWASFPNTLPSANTWWNPLTPDGAVYVADPTDPLQPYSVPTVYSFTLSYQQTWKDNSGNVKTISVNSGQEFMGWLPQYNNTVVAPPPQSGCIFQQDLNSRYWWAADYNWVITRMNYTLQGAWLQTYLNFVTAAAAANVVNPYSTYQAWLNGVGIAPQLTWDGCKQCMSLYADSSCWGQRLLPFVNLDISNNPTATPYCRAFMNTNMYGLLSGFPSIYWNTTTIPGPVAVYYIPGTDGGYPDLTGIQGGAYEFFFQNEFYSNVADYRVSPYGGTPPLGFVPTTAISGELINYQKVYWVIGQDFNMVDTLWSPIQSLVFTSQLMPIVKEFASDPVVLGFGNLGNSAPVAPSAFQPIITDIDLDLAGKYGGAAQYRGFITFHPTAEYRMADVAGNQPIRSVDVQLWWKNRLDGQLYPVNMFNLSSVSIKMLFRKKAIGA
jgi:hypothetical protein